MVPILEFFLKKPTSKLAVVEQIMGGSCSINCMGMSNDTPRILTQASSSVAEASDSSITGWNNCELTPSACSMGPYKKEIKWYPKIKAVEMVQYQ
jgi:hypothetical protein